jgi:hypothetical protein
MVGTILFLNHPHAASVLCPRLLLALPGINRFFQMAIFKLGGLFRSQIVGQDDCFDDSTFHHRLVQFSPKQRADIFQLAA